MSDVFNQISEIRHQRSDVGGQMSGVGVVEAVAHRTGTASACIIIIRILLEKSNLFPRLKVFIQELLYGLKYYSELFIVP